MRRRLVAAIAAVAAVAVLAFAIPLGIVVGRTYDDRALLRLQRDTVAATRGIDVTAGGRDPIELPDTPDRLGAYDRRGRLVAGTAPEGDATGLVRDALRDRRPVARAETGRLLAAVPLQQDERVTGVVLAVRDRAPTARTIRRARLALTGLALAIIAVAVAAALVLGRRLARPLERLVGAAERLGDGDFAARAPRSAVREVDAVAGALDVTAERLEALVERERTFSAGASHQLRTPLAALRLELEASALPGAAALDVDAATRQIDRLEATIATLLAASRGRAGSAGPVAVGPLVEQAEDRWRGTLAADGRPLRSVVPSGGAVVVRFPGGVLSEVLDVLLSNAHRHGDGAVTVEVRRTGDWVAIDVRDRGPGFPDAADALPDGPTGDGHGLGLRLARSLVEAEGGRLTVATEDGALVTVLVAGSGDGG
ncbi:HAMP domain-containing sensor histidine kinase [Patulibacter minatonensis]|uniref:HAMP domain-containing sensor histidine kinase n=1 Tax=Patulibacter minatonensis TaxID=298163 RepID=UPI00047B11BB|nr:HAMP domain-containing sensor histidine kinase [Patulibacter minatonensis]